MKTRIVLLTLCLTASASAQESPERALLKGLKISAIDKATGLVTLKTAAGETMSFPLSTGATFDVGQSFDVEWKKSTLGLPKGKGRSFSGTVLNGDFTVESTDTAPRGTLPFNLQSLKIPEGMLGVVSKQGGGGRLDIFLDPDEQKIQIILQPKVLEIVGDNPLRPLPPPPPTPRRSPRG